MPKASAPALVTSGAKASGVSGVGIHIECVGEGLPRIPHHQPGKGDQVPGYPREFLSVVMTGFEELPHELLDGVHEVQSVKGEIIEGCG